MKKPTRAGCVRALLIMIACSTSESPRLNALPCAKVCPIQSCFIRWFLQPESPAVVVGIAARTWTMFGVAGSGTCRLTGSAGCVIMWRRPACHRLGPARRSCPGGDARSDAVPAGVPHSPCACELVRACSPVWSAAVGLRSSINVTGLPVRRAALTRGLAQPGNGYVTTEVGRLATSGPVRTLHPAARSRRR